MVIFWWPRDRGGTAPTVRPKDMIAGYIKSQWARVRSKAAIASTLLRDADGDGAYEEERYLCRGLNAPYGLALVNGSHLRRQPRRVVRFDFQDGQTHASGPPAKVTELPSSHQPSLDEGADRQPGWTFFYVGIGSNSNITERGWTLEVDRAMVWQVDAQTGAHKPLLPDSQPHRARAFNQSTGPNLGGR